MNLQLSLKRQWFEMTKAGIKTEDYRELNLYWFKRLVFKKELVIDYLNINSDEDVKRICKDKYLSRTFGFKPFTQTTLTLGYPKSTDTDRILKFEHEGIEIRTGNPEWGAEPEKIYFVIKHGKSL